MNLIEQYAFYECSDLNHVTLPDNKDLYLGSCVFDKCINLTHVTIPDCIESLYNSRTAFDGAGCEEQVKRDYSNLFELDFDTLIADDIDDYP